MQDRVDYDWLNSALGQYMLACEQQFYDEEVANVFGYHALQIGMQAIDFLAQSRIPVQLQTAQTQTAQTQVRSLSEYLPFDCDTMDLVCLPHSLEFSEDPHQTLREVARILVPEGHVLITGMNPLSSWGVRRRLSKKKAYPWCGRSLTLGRAKDWLKLLGFEVMQTGHLAYASPINDEKWLNRQCGIAKFSERYASITGGVYYIVAKKRVANMRLIKPDWKKAISAKHLIPTPNKRHLHETKQSQEKEALDAE